MPRTAVIIPARNEPYLTKTVDDVFTKARGEIRVYAILEGYWPEGWDKTADKYPGRLVTIHHGQPHGMRSSINQAANVAYDCDYLLKCDAHVMFAKGFDLVLQKDCPSRTIVVPRRYRLDAEKWQIIKDGRPPVDYEYLTPPDHNGGGLKGRVWEQRALENKDLSIDDLWLFQGSCWFMPRGYFHELDLMDEENYGTFWKEALELSCKAWLSGGRVIVNKNTWYAHLHKASRGYSMLSEDQVKAHEFSKKWLDDSTGWEKQTLPFASLLERFQPPGWENWKGTNGVSEV